MPDNDKKLSDQFKTLLKCSNCGKEMEDSKDFRCIICGKLFCEYCESMCPYCGEPICEYCAINIENKYSSCPSCLANQYENRYFHCFDKIIEFFLLDEFKVHFIALETEQYLGKWIDLANMVISQFEKSDLKLSRYNSRELIKGYDAFLDASQKISTLNREVATDYYGIERKLLSIKKILHRENKQLSDHLTQLDQHLEDIHNNEIVHEYSPTLNRNHKSRRI